MDWRVLLCPLCSLTARTYPICDTGSIILSIITATIGIYTLAMGLEGYVLGHIVTLPVRLLLGCFSLFLILPGLLTDVIGIAAIASVVLIVVRGKKGTVSQAV